MMVSRLDPARGFPAEVGPHRPEALWSAAVRPFHAYHTAPLPFGDIATRQVAGTLVQPESAGRRGASIEQPSERRQHRRVRTTEL
jgi:hypothetical protein